MAVGRMGGIGALWALGMMAAPTASACTPGDIGTGTARSAIDGRTLLLDDGREVLLAGIEVDQHDDASLASSRGRLHDLVSGRPVALKGLGPAKDRYGRVVALVFASGEATSLQERLLEQGQARVGARAGDRSCADRLKRSERDARTARRGLWAEAGTALRRADRPAEILADRGRFTVVEGRVVSVRESGATVYVNFGRRWTEDFTATALKRHEKAFASAGVSLKSLAGRTVRVRGVVEERGGPWIELSRPEQIELSDR
jgi:endonuclease YncB( thermonuclease family)